MIRSARLHSFAAARHVTRLCSGQQAHSMVAVAVNAAGHSHTSPHSSPAVVVNAVKPWLLCCDLQQKISGL